MILLAAASASCLVCLVAHVLVPRRRSLKTRLGPYAALSRARIAPSPFDASIASLTTVDDSSVVAGVLAAPIGRLAELLGSVIDIADDETLERRLRHAGFIAPDVDHYRVRQMGDAVAGVTVGAMLGLTLLGSSGGVLLLMVAFGFPAATRQRNRVQRSIDRRRDRMRADVPTVAELIAVHVRSGRGPLDAIRSVCAVGSGPLVDELDHALVSISHGQQPVDVHAALAETTAEPAAARLHRMLAASARSGGDVGVPLLALGADIRAQRRDELGRSAAKRRLTMVVPLLLLIAPVMTLFVGAALPSIVLGSP